MTFKKVFSDLEKLILKADHASLEGEFAFQCCVVGDGEGTFYIAFKDGVLDVQPYDYKNHTAVFKADADTYKRVLGGEMTAAEAVEKGLLSVENNESGCADILTFLSAKGTTKKTAAKKPAAKTTAAAKKPAARTTAKAEAKPAAKTEAKPAAKAAVKAEAKEEAPAKKAAAAKKPAAKTTAAAKKPGARKGTK